MSCSNDCKSNGVFAFSCLDNLLQTSWPSLDPRRPVWVLIASIFLPFLRGTLAAYTCLVSSRPAEWGRLLHMLTRHLQSLTLAVLCDLGAVTGWGGVWVRCCVMAGIPGPLLMIGRQGIQGLVGSPDGASTLVVGNVSILMPSWRYGCCSQVLPTPQLRSTPKYSGWGEKGVSLFCRFSQSWRADAHSQALTFLCGEIAGQECFPWSPAVCFEGRSDEGNVKLFP